MIVKRLFVNFVYIAEFTYLVVLFVNCMLDAWSFSKLRIEITVGNFLVVFSLSLLILHVYLQTSIH